MKVETICYYKFIKDIVRRKPITKAVDLGENWDPFHELYNLGDAGSREVIDFD